MCSPVGAVCFAVLTTRMELETTSEVKEEMKPMMAERCRHESSMCRGLVRESDATSGEGRQCVERTRQESGNGRRRRV